MEEQMKKVFLFLFVFIFLSSLFVMSVEKKTCSKEKAKKEYKLKHLKCPVSGKIIAKDAKKIKAEYKGKTYYFCCEKCKETFLKNPEKYTKCTEAKPVYYCPMEKCKYKSDKPGKCPKCGMELKKHEHKPVYACPVEGCKYKSDKPGKCPKCGKELKKVCCKDAHKKIHTSTKDKKQKSTQKNTNINFE